MEGLLHRLIPGPPRGRKLRPVGRCRRCREPVWPGENHTRKLPGIVEHETCPRLVKG